MMTTTIDTIEITGSLADYQNQIETIVHNADANIGCLKADAAMKTINDATKYVKSVHKLIADETLLTSSDDLRSQILSKQSRLNAASMRASRLIFKKSLLAQGIVWSGK